MAKGVSNMAQLGWHQKEEQHEVNGVGRKGGDGEECGAVTRCMWTVVF